MALSITLAQYLSDHHIPYDMMVHRPTHTAMTTAHSAHVPAESLAKAVLMRDEEGFLLAVIPAANVLETDTLARRLGHPVRMADEADMISLFKDCEIGAVPPIGEAWHLRTLWDDSLVGQEEVYFEGGDHRTLVQVGRNDFLKMMGHADHGVFSHHL